MKFSAHNSFSKAVGQLVKLGLFQLLLLQAAWIIEFDRYLLVNCWKTLAFLFIKFTLQIICIFRGWWFFVSKCQRATGWLISRGNTLSWIYKLGRSLFKLFPFVNLSLLRPLTANLWRLRLILFKSFANA